MTLSDEELRTRNAAYQRKWYASNRSVQNDRALEQKAKNVVRNEQILQNFLKDKNCSICNEQNDLWLDCPNIQRLINQAIGLKRFQKTLKESEVVCKPCLEEKRKLRRTASNIKKEEVLDMPFGTAQNRLRKELLFHLAQLTQMDTCFRCSQPILSAKDLTIEHKKPWLSAGDKAKELFWSIENVAFSHAKCNRPNLK